MAEANPFKAQVLQHNRIEQLCELGECDGGAQNFCRSNRPLLGAQISNMESWGVNATGEKLDAYCIPDYITTDVEERLLDHLRTSRAKWVKLSGRRSQYHGGVVHNGRLVQVPLPSWLQTLCERLHKEVQVFGKEPPNHVLVNAYLPGEGIMPHEDGPLYFPGVTILSLGAPAVIRFWRKSECGSLSDNPDASFLLPPRSLFVFKDAAYTKYMHGIYEVHEEIIDESVVNADDCGACLGDQIVRGAERISLTVRRVLNVKKGLFRL